MNLLMQNAECLATLVGVILYESLKSVTEALGIGFAAVLFGVVLTAAGVIMTFKAKKGAKGTAIALAIHAAIWLLKGLIGWIAGVAIALFIILRVFGKSGTGGQEASDSLETITFAQLPQRMSSGTSTYYCTGRSSLGAEYVNERNPSEVISITNIYSSTSTEVDTNAGHFHFLP